MVTGSAIFTNNLYRRFVSGRADSHYLWVARFASAGLLAAGMYLALRAESLTQVLLASIHLVGALGGAFWLGVVWRRANALGVWLGFTGALFVWLGSHINPQSLSLIPSLVELVVEFQKTSQAFQILIMLALEFGLMVLGSFLSSPLDEKQLNPFFARLHTPVGKESEIEANGKKNAAPHTLGFVLDYQTSSAFSYTRLRRFGLEIPRLTWIDWGGFLAATVLVGMLMALLQWLATIGS